MLNILKVKRWRQSFCLKKTRIEDWWYHEKLNSNSVGILIKCNKDGVFMYHYEIQKYISLWNFHLDWLFILVLSVAREWEPWDRCVAISSFVLTSALVTPGSVLTPSISLIFKETLARKFGTSKSYTSFLSTCHHIIPHQANKLK